MNVAKGVTQFLDELDRVGHFNEVQVEDIERSGYWHQEYAMF